jgi:hypothetical protein
MALKVGRQIASRSVEGLRDTFNRGQRDSVGTKKLHRTDYGSQNQEGAAGNNFELLRSLATSADCTERADQPLTSGMLDVPSRIATMNPSQPTSDTFDLH